MSAPFALATPALATTPVAGFEAETMSLSTSLGRISADSKASGGKMLTVWANGAALKSLTTSEAADRLTVRVRGSQCSGAPKMQVKVDGIQVLSASVSTTYYRDLVSSVQIPAGAHKVTVGLTNDYRTSSCDRNIFIDTVALTTEVTPPVSEPDPVLPEVPTETPEPTAGPTTKPSISDLVAGVQDGVATISFTKSGGDIESLTWRTTGTAAISGQVAEPNVSSFSTPLPPGTYTVYVRAANALGTDEDPVTVTVPTPTPEPSDPTAPGAPITLKTGFEARNGSSWTTLTEEQDYLRALDAASDRVSVSEIGRSVQGRPIQLVTVGAPRTQAEIAAGSSVLFVCTQHGNEPAGRDACLSSARDYVNATDATTVLIVPTANPDGVAARSRHTATGVDMNRDHNKLGTPEARALSAVIRDYKPDLLGDMHEYPWSDTKVLVGSPTGFHQNVDAQVEDAVVAMTGSYVLPALKGAGFPTDYYPGGGGEADESVLRQQAALRHVPTLLMETSFGGAMSNLQRAKAHRLAIGALMKMVGERTAELAAATNGAAQRAIAEGAAGNQRYWFTSPSLYSDTPPCGYRLTDTQYRSIQRTLELVGVAATPQNGSWTISAAQAAQPIIGLLLDSRSLRELTVGTRLSC